MNIHRYHCFLWLLLGLCMTINAQKVNLETIPLNANTFQINLTIPLSSREYLYADNISLAVDHPSLTISSWKSSIEPIMRYDHQYKEIKRIFETSPVIIATLSKPDESLVDNASLHLVYYTNKSKTAIESLIPLTFLSDQEDINNEMAREEPINETASQAHDEPIKTAPTAPAGKSTGWTNYLTNLMQATQHLWVRILLALLLGLLLSLTPCIYPMIPITMGILQAQGTKSMWRNFFLSLSYTIGIATTFALLGVVAALAGHLFGSLLTHPIVILFIVGLLIYVALSLFGFYDIYMPKSLRNRQLATGVSGFLAAFLFGAVSGTVASPCLSPGIFFMLTLVATLKSPFVGFALLFAFGIGLSLPLLVVGTFSSSLALMPRAGAWMNEIKYFFGFMMLGMCCYFLSSLLPFYVILWLLSCLSLSTGIFYIARSRMFEHAGKKLYILMGILFVASSVFIAVKGFQAFLLPQQQSSIGWLNDYSIAHQQAIQERKPLFVFVHAPMCMACMEVEEHLTNDKKFIKEIKRVIPVSLDLSEQSPTTKAFQEKFTIMGAPACLLIESKTENTIKRWDGELSSEQLNDLIESIQNVKQQPKNS